MNILDFKAGYPRKGYRYQYFMPEKVNHPFSWDDGQINYLLEQASMKVGELNAFSRFVPDIDMFIRMHVVKEAVVSSKIEGTQTNMEDALMEPQELNPEKRDDWEEVNNYILAMKRAIDQLEEWPLSNRLLKAAHANLMAGVRGEHKAPGDFRTSQNWIGGATITDAVFIPPLGDEVSDLMADLELFLHNEDINVPHLIKLAIAHYQFETIHPFLDGNGRLGRLMITLYLVSNKVLDRPLLYLSDFFEKNRTLYYDKLMTVRNNNDLKQWLVFFLVGVIETATKATNALSGIVELKERAKDRITNTGNRRAPKALKLLEHLWSSPIVLIKDVQKACGLTPKAAGDMANYFVEIGILAEVSGHQRNRVFLFKEYLELFKQ